MSQRVGVRRITTSIGVVAAMLTGLLSLLPPPAGAVSPDVVISQVYGGGGNTGAPFTNDFVELFNRGDAPVDLERLVGAVRQRHRHRQLRRQPGRRSPASSSPASTTWCSWRAAPAASRLPTPDATGTINMIGHRRQGHRRPHSDRPAVQRQRRPAVHPGPARPLIVDLVGYGNANFFEGAAAAPTLSNTTSGPGGRPAAPTPTTTAPTSIRPRPAPATRHRRPARAAATPLRPRSHASVPANGATGVAVGTERHRHVQRAGDRRRRRLVLDHLRHERRPPGVATAADRPRSPSIPTTDFAAGEACTVTIVGAGRRRSGRRGPARHDGRRRHRRASRPRPAPPPVAIHDIQGASHTSPRGGTGVVARCRPSSRPRLSNGFYLQDPAPDADDATSEAIFVFTGSAPAVDHRRPGHGQRQRQSSSGPAERPATT